MNTLKGGYVPPHVTSLNYPMHLDDWDKTKSCWVNLSLILPVSYNLRKMKLIQIFQTKLSLGN